MSVLEELSAATRRVSEKAAGAAVGIGRDRRGTGVVIGLGQVLTNAHNLRDRTTSVTPPRPTTSFCWRVGLSRRVPPMRC